MGALVFEYGLPILLVGAYAVHTLRLFRSVRDPLKGKKNWVFERDPHADQAWAYERKSSSDRVGPRRD